MNQEQLKEKVKELREGYRQVDFTNEAELAFCIMTTTQESDLKNLKQCLKYLRNERVYVMLNLDPEDTVNEQDFVNELDMSGAYCCLLVRQNDPYDFASMRNRFIDDPAVNAKWLFFLDPDERITNLDMIMVKQCLKTNADGVFVLNHSIRESLELVELYQLRLIRKDSGIRWTYNIHEVLSVSAKLLKKKTIYSPAMIRHLGYTSAFDTLGKIERNLKSGIKALAKLIDDPNATDDDIYHYLKDIGYGAVLVGQSMHDRIKAERGIK